MVINYPIVNGSTFTVFNSPEESVYYAQCLYSLVFNRISGPSNIVEFGSGDGSPVVQAIMHSGFKGRVEGFELNKSAAQKAVDNVKDNKLDDHYHINKGSFFDLVQFNKDDILISDPPFLPSNHSNILDPLLWGGNDGSDIYLKLIGMGYEKAMLMVASYSNPLKILSEIRNQNYAIQDFMVAPMSMGIYSKEKPVWDKLNELKNEGLAFHSNSHFLLAGVLIEKEPSRKDYCLINELGNVLTSLR